MEDCENKVINLQAISPRILVNLLADTLEEPQVIGGPWGAYPLRALSRVYFPPAEGCHGLGLGLGLGCGVLHEQAGLNQSS